MKRNAEKQFIGALVRVQKCCKKGISSKLSHCWKLFVKYLLLYHTRVVNREVYVDLSSFVLKLTLWLAKLIDVNNGDKSGRQAKTIRNEAGGNFTRGFAACEFPRGSRGKKNGGSAAKYRTFANSTSYAGYFLHLTDFNMMVNTFSVFYSVEH